MAINVPGGVAAIYRCDGRFWALPATKQLGDLFASSNSVDHAYAAMMTSSFRSDLGPLSLGTMSLVYAVLANPERLASQLGIEVAVPPITTERDYSAGRDAEGSTGVETARPIERSAGSGNFPDPVGRSAADRRLRKVAKRFWQDDYEERLLTTIAGSSNAFWLTLENDLALGTVEADGAWTIFAGEHLRDPGDGRDVASLEDRDLSWRAHQIAVPETGARRVLAASVDPLINLVEASHDPLLIRSATEAVMRALIGSKSNEDMERAARRLTPEQVSDCDPYLLDLLGELNRGPRFAALLEAAHDLAAADEKIASDLFDDLSAFCAVRGIGLHAQRWKDGEHAWGMSLDEDTAVGADCLVFITSSRTGPTRGQWLVSARVGDDIRDRRAVVVCDRDDPLPKVLAALSVGLIEIAEESASVEWVPRIRKAADTLAG